MGFRLPRRTVCSPSASIIRTAGAVPGRNSPTMQLKYKQQVVDQFSRIGHLDNFYRIKSRMVALCLNPLQSCILNILGEYLS